MPTSIIGVVAITDLISIFANGQPLEIRKFVQPVPVVMDHADALDVVRAIRNSTVHMALVVDEYGHFEGIVTSGRYSRSHHRRVPGRNRRRPGRGAPRRWLLSRCRLDARRRIQPTSLGVAIPRDAKFETVAGYVLSIINRLPAVGETFEHGGWKFEVVDLDGRRIDKMMMTRIE